MKHPTPTKQTPDLKALGAWGAYLRSKSRAWLAKPDLFKAPTKKRAPSSLNREIFLGIEAIFFLEVRVLGAKGSEGLVEVE